METIAAILKKVAANLKSTTVEEGPEPEEECPACEGRGSVRRAVDLDHPDFGKMVPCQACTPSPESFFKGLKVKEGNQKAIEASVQMALRPDGWLVLVGKRGTGKTTLLKAIISAIKREESIPMTTTALLDYWREMMNSGLFQSRFRDAQELPMLALDDLEAPKATDWAVERLTELLDYRYARRLPTIITTDLDEVGIAKALGPRLADRVFDQGTGLARVVTIDGPSYRTGREW